MRPVENVMVDLETLGTVPGCVILSIGAVAFDIKSRSIVDKFYTVISEEDSVSRGLVVNKETVEWWERQSPEAQKVLEEAREIDAPKLDSALYNFTSWLAKYNTMKVKVWGNGSDFDNAILSNAYDVLGQKIPWSFWNNRCYRTLSRILQGPPIKKAGVIHNALDDAQNQAIHMMKILDANRRVKMCIL